VRTVWRLNQLPYSYVITNKSRIEDESITDDYQKYILDLRIPNTCTIVKSSAGTKHTEETVIYVQNVVKYIEKFTGMCFT
jgi:hypothetical protein